MIELLIKDELRVDSEDDCLEFIIDYIVLREQLESKVPNIEKKEEEKKQEKNEKTEEKPKPVLNKNDLAKERIKNYKLGQEDISWLLMSLRLS